MLRKKSSVTRSGIGPGTFRLVSQRLKHYATPGPFISTYTFIYFFFFVLMWRIYIWSVSKCSRYTLYSGICGRSYCSRFFLLSRFTVASRLLGLRVRTPQETWMSLTCVWCVLSGRGLCVGPITHPEESYRVWCVWVWSWILHDNESPAHQRLLCRRKKKWNKTHFYSQAY